MLENDTGCEMFADKRKQAHASAVITSRRKLISPPVEKQSRLPGEDTGTYIT